MSTLTNRSVKQCLEELNIDYDKTNDVLYVSFGPPRKAICVDVRDGNLVRLDMKTNEIVGVTILDFRRKYIDESTFDKSWRRKQY